MEYAEVLRQMLPALGPLAVVAFIAYLGAKYGPEVVKLARDILDGASPSISDTDKAALEDGVQAIRVEFPPNLPMPATSFGGITSLDTMGLSFSEEPAVVEDEGGASDEIPDDVIDALADAAHKGYRGWYAGAKPYEGIALENIPPDLADVLPIISTVPQMNVTPPQESFAPVTPEPQAESHTPPENMDELMPTVLYEEEAGTIGFNSYSKDGSEVLSNFAATPLLGKNGRTYPTAEHAYQAAKTADPTWHERIANARTPQEAKALGRQAPLRQDWASMQVDVMRRIITAKMDQHPEIAEFLINTGSAELIHVAPWDKFWGAESIDGEGKNIMGQILMEIRSDLLAKKAMADVPSAPPAGQTLELSVVSKRSGGTPSSPDADHVVIARPSPLGNPFVLHNEHDDAERAQVIQQYRDWLTPQVDAYLASGVVTPPVAELLKIAARDGKVELVCWCAPRACHGDVVIEQVARLNAPREAPMQPAADDAFTSTIDSTNRVRDAARVMTQHPLLSEQGRADVIIKSKSGDIIATGYDRVVYGDHGPYIELSAEQVNFPSFPRHRVKSDMAWYDEWYLPTGEMLYEQKRDVSMLRNPPAGQYSVANNRPEGYADYIPGKFYISPDDVVVSRGQSTPVSRVDYIAGQSVRLPITGQYAAKDQRKADQATKFIGSGSPRSSTAQYAAAFGDLANSGAYTATDVVFISAEGNRSGRQNPDFEEIRRAIDARATFITDAPGDRERAYNVGERLVAQFLADNGYIESSPGRWTPGRAAQPGAKPDWHRWLKPKE